MKSNFYLSLIICSEASWISLSGLKEGKPDRPHRVGRPADSDNQVRAGPHGDSGGLSILYLGRQLCVPVSRTVCPISRKTIK